MLKGDFRPVDPLMGPLMGDAVSLLAGVNSCGRINVRSVFNQGLESEH